MKNIVAAAIITASLFLGACAERVGPGHAGIKVNLAGDNRGVDEIPTTTGWVFYVPFKSEVLEWPTYVQQVQLKAEEGNGITFSSESMTLGADVAYSYSLRADKVPAFYVKFRTEDMEAFSHGFLKNIIQEKFNDESKKVNIEKITAGDSSFLNNVKAAVQKEIEPYGLQLESQFGIIGAVRLPEQVVQSINAKVQATQIAQQKEAELQQVQADMAKERAKAETYAQNRLTQANAEAQANKLVAASITSELLELEPLKKWNGELPQVNGGSTNPFISLAAK